VALTGGRSERNNDFRYTEAIQAGYAQAEGQHFGFTWQAGLRGEWTHSTATLINEGSPVDRRYGQLFPSLSLDHPVTKTLGVNMAYSRRIDRPSYQDLNPSIQYLDPYTSQRGNSFLTPQFTNNYKAALTYNKQPFVILSYGRTTDAISLVTATEDSAIYSTTANLDYLNRYSATLNAPLNFAKMLTGYAGVNVVHNQYLSQYLGSTFRRGRTAATFYAQANVQLPHQWKLEASGFYQTALIDGLLNIRSFGSFNLGAQKSLLNDRATLRLTVNDVLFSNKQRGTVNYQDVNVAFLSYSESRQARVSFTYKIGNQQLKAARRRATGLDEERARVKSEKD
jgi:outer membrane receptor protein involved in Fe transport